MPRPPPDPNQAAPSIWTASRLFAHTEPRAPAPQPLAPAPQPLAPAQTASPNQTASASKRSREEWEDWAEGRGRRPSGPVPKASYDDVYGRPGQGLRLNPAAPGNDDDPWARWEGRGRSPPRAPGASSSSWWGGWNEQQLQEATGASSWNEPPATAPAEAASRGAAPAPGPPAAPEVASPGGMAAAPAPGPLAAPEVATQPPGRTLPPRHRRRDSSVRKQSDRKGRLPC